MQRPKLQYVAPLAGLVFLGLLVAGVFYKQNFGQDITFPSLGNQEISLDCKDIDREGLLVILVVGQSISSNFGSTRYTAGKNVFSFYNGNCYAGNDPLPGADGTGGSVWSRLGDRLVQRGLAKNVLLVAIGSGGSSVSEWVPDAKLYPRLVDAASSLRVAGIKPNFVIWFQGSRDQRMDPDRYRNLLHEFIYSFPFLGITLGQPTRLLVATHTRCKSGPVPELQAAQQSVVNPAEFVFAGPNMDVLEDDLKYDGCHYNERGLNLAATMWLGAIERALPSTSQPVPKPSNASTKP